MPRGSAVAGVAAIAPWETLWRLVRAGAAPWEWVAKALQNRSCATGPVAAAIAGLRDAGLGFDGRQVVAAGDAHGLDPCDQCDGVRFWPKLAQHPSTSTVFWAISADLGELRRNVYREREDMPPGTTQLLARRSTLAKFGPNWAKFGPSFG